MPVCDYKGNIGHRNAKHFSQKNLYENFILENFLDNIEIYLIDF